MNIITCFHKYFLIYSVLITATVNIDNKRGALSSNAECAALKDLLWMEVSWVCALAYLRIMTEILLSPWLRWFFQQAKRNKRENITELSFYAFKMNGFLKESTKV